MSSGMCRSGESGCERQYAGRTRRVKGMPTKAKKGREEKAARSALHRQKGGGVTRLGGVEAGSMDWLAGRRCARWVFGSAELR